MAALARVVASFDGQPAFVAAGTHEGRRRCAVWGDGAVKLFDDRLREIGSRLLTLPDSAHLQMSTPELERLAFTVDDGVRLILGDRSVHVPVPRADAAAIVGGMLLATAPAAHGHRFLLINPAAGAVLVEETVDADDAFAFITVHPSESVALVELAMGQDGCMVLRAEVSAETLQLTEVLPGQDAVVAGFHRSGDQVLVVSHPNDADAVRVLAWPSLEEFGRLSAADLDTEIGMGMSACWVDDDRIAAYAMEDALVLLRSPERVPLPIEFGDGGDLESLLPLSPGKVAVGVWTPEGRSTLMIEL